MGMRDMGEARLTMGVGEEGVKGGFWLPGLHIWTHYSADQGGREHRNGPGLEGGF